MPCTAPPTIWPSTSIGLTTTPQSWATAYFSMCTRPSLDVDLDQRDMHRIGPGDGRRLVVICLLESGIDALRPAVIPARARRLRDLGERRLPRPGTPTMPTPPLRNSRSPARALQQIGGDREHLGAQPLARAVNRRRQRHGAAARDRAEAHRDGRRVGKRNDHVVGIDAPGIGDDLRKDRLHALPLRAGAGGDVDLAGRIDAHRRAFERADAGALDIAADAEAEIAALFARRALALAKRRQAADRIERFVAAPPDSRRCRRRSARRRDTECRCDRASRRRGSCCATRTSAGSRPSSTATRSIDPLHGEGGLRAGRRRDRARSAPCWWRRCGRRSQASSIL